MEMEKDGRNILPFDLQNRIRFIQYLVRGVLYSSLHIDQLVVNLLWRSFSVFPSRKIQFFSIRFRFAAVFAVSNKIAIQTYIFGKIRELYDKYK